jgi:asparagine synthetase B (glutamine-hydrolysing)
LQTYRSAGTYQSGGVDSSLVTALAARERHGGALHTFSAGFGDNRLDETSWARKVAGIIGTTHHEVRGNSRLLSADLVEVELASGRAAVRARRSRGFSACSDGA